MGRKFLASVLFLSVLLAIGGLAVWPYLPAGAKALRDSPPSFDGYSQEDRKALQDLWRRTRGLPDVEFLDKAAKILNNAPSNTNRRRDEGKIQSPAGNDEPPQKAAPRESDCEVHPPPQNKNFGKF